MKLILGVALFGSFTSFLVAYNSIVTALIATCALAIWLHRVYGTFGKKDYERSKRPLKQFDPSKHSGRHGHREER